MTTERKLIVGLDQMAAVRQARGGREPDPVAGATLALLAGADGVGVHLRQDRAHVSDRDARVLRQTVERGFVMNIGTLPEMMKVALETRPDAVTLVPEVPEALTPAGGLDVPSQLGALGEIARALEDGKIQSGLLIAPDLEHVKSAHRVGVAAVQLHTARFAEGGPDRDEELERIRDAARLAHKLGLMVAVGGRLDYRNVKALLTIDEISEFRIGYAIMARALLVGLERSVREMKGLVG